MTKRLIALSALAALLAAGCSSDKGGTSDQDKNAGYSPGTTEQANPNTPPDGSGGPVRGPGTGGMGGTSPNPSGTNSDNGSSQGDQNQAIPPDNNPQPSSPDNNGQQPQ